MAWREGRTRARHVSKRVRAASPNGAQTQKRARALTRRLHAHGHADALQRRLQLQRVHHRGQHAARRGAARHQRAGISARGGAAEWPARAQRARARAHKRSVNGCGRDAPHVVCGGAVEAFALAVLAAEKVAAADDNCDLRAAGGGV
jgi:hypothetical protein